MAMDAGRASDYVRSPYDGSLIMGAVLCDKLITEGTQTQIVQDATDHLVVRVRRTIADVDLDATERHVRETVDMMFHGCMRTSIEVVDTIAREKSGKLRVCINTCTASEASHPPA